MADFLSNLILGGLQEGQRRRQSREELDKIVLEAKVKSLFPEPLHLLNILSLIESRKESQSSREQTEQDRLSNLYAALLTHRDTLSQRGHGWGVLTGEQPVAQDQLDNLDRIIEGVQGHLLKKPTPSSADTSETPQIPAGVPGAPQTVGSDEGLNLLMKQFPGAKVRRIKSGKPSASHGQFQALEDILKNKMASP